MWLREGNVSLRGAQPLNRAHAADPHTLGQALPILLLKPFLCWTGTMKNPRGDGSAVRVSG